MSGWRTRFEPVITPVFRFWWRVRRPMTLGVRGVAQDESGAVLLVRHTYASGWHLPGGGVEPGETAVEAIVREMAEEGGVESIGAPTLLGLYSNHANFPNDHIALYRVDRWRPCAPREAGEIAERGFFQPHALPQAATPGTRRRLAELFAGAAVAAAW
jgi:ADP-ribose pyrophosphatase YjhB (NUDIX family)